MKKIRVFLHGNSFSKRIKKVYKTGLVFVHFVDPLYQTVVYAELKLHSYTPTPYMPF
jgi:hypothetical protein